MKQLDRKRAFYQVSGHVGAVFEQDGVLFDDSGNEFIEDQECGANPVLGDETAAALAEESGRLRDLLDQKQGEIAGQAEKLEELTRLNEEMSVGLNELQRKLKKADEQYEEEVSRADGLQAKVADLEKQLAEMNDAGFPDLPSQPATGGNGKADKKQ